jgi:hypothetical protein
MFEQSEVQGEGPFCRCLGEALKAFLNRSFEVGTDTCEGNENRSISTLFTTSREKEMPNNSLRA